MSHKEHHDLTVVDIFMPHIRLIPTTRCSVGQEGVMFKDGHAGLTSPLSHPKALGPKYKQAKQGS